MSSRRSSYISQIYVKRFKSDTSAQKKASKLYALFLVLAGLLIIGLIIAVAVIASMKSDKCENPNLTQAQVQAQATTKESTTSALTTTTASNTKSTSTGTTESSTHVIADTRDICLTKTCVKAATMLIESMNTSAKPCDDFYQFVCGSWIENHVIPEEKSSLSISSKLNDDIDTILKSGLEKKDETSDVESIKKARRYYRSCVDLDRIENLTLTRAHPYFRELGGWPVLGNKLGGNWNSSAFDLKKALIKIREFTNSPPIMDMYVYDDSKHPKKSILYIDQPVLAMPERTYYLKERNDKQLMAYQNYATGIAKLFGADKTTAQKDMEDVVDFEIKLANLSMPAAERRDAEKLYNPMTIQELKGNYSGFDWLGYFKATLGIPSLNITVDPNEVVIVRNPEYISKIFQIVNDTPKRTLQNYIVWRAIKWMVISLPKSARDLSQIYGEALTGVTRVPPRWKTCVGHINSEFAMASGRLYIKRAFNGEAKKSALELIENLRVSMKNLISNTEWMDENTKRVAKDKADYITPRIGFSDDILNDNILHEKYNRFKISDDFFDNNVKSMKFYSMLNLERLRKPVNKTKWEASPAVVNAYYSPSHNHISFPAGILQPPFFDKNYPRYLNYGGIGYVIGHEITHAFDDNGRRYDKNGNLHPWWSQSSRDNFKKRANCTINQYGSYTVEEVNEKLNGKLTLGENIADNGGLKESFQAYRNWVEKNGKEEKKLPGLDFTPNQLFFMSAGHVWCGKFRPKEAHRRILTDPHSHRRYRVIGTMQYNDDFAKAFNCPKGSFMNPVHKCKIW